MNDRLKFRVWNKARECFLSEDEIFICGKGELVIIDADLNRYWVKDNPNYEVKFCTGLKDKNGKLIYEGDILKDKYGALHPISWNIKGFYKADTFAVAGFYNAIQEDMEVIGNIYENKELLEEYKGE